MSGSSSSGDVKKTQISWGPIKKLLTNDLAWAFVILPILIVLTTVAGRLIKVHDLGAMDSNPEYLHEGDILYLNANNALTITLSSKMPFEIKTGSTTPQLTINAPQEFDNNYWLRNTEVTSGGFRITSAKAPVKLVVIYADFRPPHYTFYSENKGFPIVDTFIFGGLLWIIRIVMAAFILFIPFHRFVILPEENLRRGSGLSRGSWY